MSECVYYNGTPSDFLGYIAEEEHFKEELLNRLASMSNGYVNIEEVNKRADKFKLLLDGRRVPIKGASLKDEEFANIKIVGTGIIHPGSKEEICISSCKSYGVWSGLFTGTFRSLLERTVDSSRFKTTISFEDKNIINRLRNIDNLNGSGYLEILDNNKEVVKNTLMDDIYDNLLIKESWKTGEINRLPNYIRIVCNKAIKDYTKSKQMRGNGYVISDNMKSAIVNTGLIDKFGNDVFIIVKDIVNDEMYGENYETFVSKSRLIADGFSKDNIKYMPEPVKFYKDIKDLVFTGTIEDIDLDDTKKITHVIEERMSRLPEDVRSSSIEVISSLLKESIRRAMSVAKRDYKYIVPMYNIKLDCIQYMIPLHFNKSLDDCPEVVGILSYNGGFYGVSTIINCEAAYDNARTIARPDSNWLKIN